ncbi:MAG: hypothetical protein ABL903_13865 [Methylococcales bacterium]
MTKANSQRPPEIITHLARQVSHILADYLSNPELLNKRHALEDRCAVKLILTLSKSEKYRQELLFRDYRLDHDELWIDLNLLDGSTQKAYAESEFYVQAVLGKRLQLVAKHKSFPTNLHFLLLMLCRYSLDTNWLKTWVKRKRNSGAEIYDVFFSKIAKKLQGQCRGIKQESAIAKNLRERFGDLYLSVGRNRAVIPAEITLFNVIETIPTPLNETIKNLPVWYAALIERILLSLNEGYGLLRACGLPPQAFWDELSIGKLRELKHLKNLAEAYMESTTKSSRYDAYEKAFNALLSQKTTPRAKDQPAQDKNTKIAGFEDFFDFAGSTVGACLLHTQFLSDADTMEGEKNYTESIPATEPRNTDLELDLENLAKTHANDFTPVTQYFFEQALIKQRPQNGPDNFFNDAQFRKLVAADKNYAHLDDNKLALKLIQKMKELPDLKAIIQAHIVP